MKDKSIGLNLNDIYAGYEIKQQAILKGINLTIHQGEFITVLGPSGGGKTTFIRLLAGLLSPWNGSIQEYFTPCGKRNITKTVVFQNDALFPWLTVEDNLIFCMRQTSLNQDSNKEQQIVNEMLNRIELHKHRKKYPFQLSGGMKQRVAFARGILMNTPLLLLDEPFSALDELRRMKMMKYLYETCRKQGKAVVMVTHNRQEASQYGDRVLVIEKGQMTIINEHK